MLRVITQLWSVLYLVFIAMNFCSVNSYDFLVSPLSALYMGLLALYVGSKEFDRWQEVHKSIRKGEMFMAVFTIVIFLMIGGAVLLGRNYYIPSDIIATYIGALSIFVITQKSKRLYERAKRR